MTTRNFKNSPQFIYPSGGSKFTGLDSQLLQSPPTPELGCHLIQESRSRVDAILLLQFISFNRCTRNSHPHEVAFVAVLLSRDMARRGGSSRKSWRYFDIAGRSPKTHICGRWNDCPRSPAARGQPRRACSKRLDTFLSFTASSGRFFLADPRLKGWCNHRSDFRSLNFCIRSTTGVGSRLMRRSFASGLPAIGQRYRGRGLGSTRRLGNQARQPGIERLLDTWSSYLVELPGRVTNRVSENDHLISPCFRSIIPQESEDNWGILYLTTLRWVVGLKITPEKHHDCLLRQSLDRRTE